MIQDLDTTMGSALPLPVNADRSKAGLARFFPFLRPRQSPPAEREKRVLALLSRSFQAGQGLSRQGLSGSDCAKVAVDAANGVACVISEAQDAVYFIFAAKGTVRKSIGKAHEPLHLSEGSSDGASPKRQFSQVRCVSQAPGKALFQLLEGSDPLPKYVSFTPRETGDRQVTWVEKPMVRRPRSESKPTPPQPRQRRSIPPLPCHSARI